MDWVGLIVFGVAFAYVVWFVCLEKRNEDV